MGAGAVLMLSVPQNAGAYDWNGKTVTHELDVLDGRMDVESGHPLATARGFELAVELGADDPTGQTDAAMSFVFGSDFVDPRSDAVQTVLFGSWLNEVRTSLDMGDPDSFLDPLGWAAEFMGLRYGNYLDEREKSDRWSESTGYSSNNYQHSMMVASVDPAEEITQDDVFDLLEEYTFWAITSASFNLMVAKKGELEGSLDPDDADLSWIAGMRYIGSVFHLIEDSSVTCSNASQELVPSCIPGDGHTLVERRDGRPMVVALSNNEYYERVDEHGDKVHAQLDGLHQEHLIDEVYGDADPALDTSQILVIVARGVDAAVHEDLAATPLFIDGEPNDAFDAAAFSLSADIAREVMDTVIDQRFADAGERVDLPALGGGEGDRPEDRVGGDEQPEASGDAGSCSVGGEPTDAPLCMAVMLGLGLLVRRRTYA